FVAAGASGANWKRLSCPIGAKKVHLGALCIAGDWVYVPIQGTEGETRRGVWKVSVDFEESVILWAPAPLVDNDLFAWCDINPHNALLYTCNFATPTILLAYDASAVESGILSSRPNANIALH